MYKMRESEILLWNNYKKLPSKKNEIDIIDYVNIQLKKSIEWFVSYYSNTEVHKKFKNKSNTINLINGIKKIKVVVNLTPTGAGVDDAWGWIYTNNLYTIYINFYNFFNGRIDSSIYDTVVHEMGHLIDFQLRFLGETPSYMEQSLIRPISKVDSYIVSREEDYARVQRLRQLLNLHPFETYTNITESLMKLVSAGSIYISDIKITASVDKRKLKFSFVKQIPSLSLSNIAGIFGNLVINEYLATDIGYMFAKYALVNNGAIEVDIEKIAKINTKFVNVGGFTDNNFV
jgi:hypothetical protein